MKKKSLLVSVLSVFLLTLSWPEYVRGQEPARSSQSSFVVDSRQENRSVLQGSTWQGLSFSNRIGRLDAIGRLPLSEVPAFRLEKNAEIPSEFTVLTMEGYSGTDREGSPLLPVKVERIELPQGAVAKVAIDNASYEDISLSDLGYDAPLSPVQPPVSKGATEIPVFRYDADAYAVDAFVSGTGNEDLVEVRETGTLRDMRIAYLIIKPFRYNPVTNTLRVYTQIDFHVAFEGADPQATLEMKRRYASDAFSFMADEVLNPITFNRAKEGAVLLPREKSESFQKPIRYVIVSDPMFKDSLQKFVKWKALFGYEVVQAYTDQVQVGNTKESIRGYLKRLYDNATEDDPAPSYVLFVGDLEQIPTKKYSGIGYGDEGHVSDLYLCEYTDDRYPDVLYGRMSATTVEELMPQIDKTMFMENIAYERTSFLDTSVIIAGVDHNFGNSHLNPTIDYIHSLYMKDTLARHGYKYPYPESGVHADDIIANINQGASVVIYTAHGLSGEWSNPNISNSDVKNRFANAGRYPLMVGNCCLTGKFDDPYCFGETLLRKENGGAAAYIGASNSSYFDQDVYWAIGYTSRLVSGAVHTYENTRFGANDALYHTHGEPFDKWAMTVSEIIHTGNMAVDESQKGLEAYYWQIYHVFGDPSYVPYTRRPEKITAVYPLELVMGDDQYTVETWPYARVALSRDGEIYGVATADASGRAVLKTKEMKMEGMYDLCVSAQNGLPHFARIKVFAPSSKYAVVKAETVKNAQGEVVETWEYAGEYVLNYKIRNIGTSAFNKLSLELVSDDPYVAFSDAEFSVEKEVAAGAELEIAHDFRIKVSADVPDGHLLSYQMRMVMDGQEDSAAVSSLRHQVKAPRLAVLGFRIDDSASIIPNGVLDNGEKAKGILVIENQGSATAADLRLDLSSRASFVSIPQASASVGLGNMVAGKRQEIAFDIEAEEGSRFQETYELEVLARTQGRTDTLSAESFLAPAFETFESGNFDYVAWDNSADAGWVIDDSKAYAGKYSAASRSGLADDEVATLMLEVNLPEDDEVSFHYYVSSERVTSAMGDFLFFYVDETEMGHWGGLGQAWSFASFKIPAGIHTLLWQYVKDGSDAEGEDRAWVDNIRLPFGTELKSVSNESCRPSSASASLFSVLKASQGELRLAFQGKDACTGRLSVSNALGQRVLLLDAALQIGTERRIESYSIGSLEPGLYFCVLESAGCGRQVVKFVVVR